MSSCSQPDTAGVEPSGSGNDFISLRQMLAMVLRRWKTITAVVLLSTIVSGVFFFTRPADYNAEGFLQLIIPLPQEGRADRDLFETMMASHLQKSASAFIAKKLSLKLASSGLETDPLKLIRKFEITRPPKSDLIRILARDKSQENALTLASMWIEEYLSILKENNIHTALSQIRPMLNQAQVAMMERKAAVENLRAELSGMEPIVTLARSVDDRQLWNEMSGGEKPDAETLKKLSGIKIRGEEQSEAYVETRGNLLVAEQALASSVMRFDLYREAARILEEQSRSGAESGNDPDPSVSGRYSAEAEDFVEVMLKSSDIIQFGEPGLLPSGRGALKKTAAFFLFSLALSCFVAFLREWGKGIMSS